MPDSLSPAERMLRAQIAAHARWKTCDDRRAATGPARRVSEGRWEREVDPDGILAPEERAKRAESAMKEHMARMAFNSAKARRLRREADALERRARNEEHWS